MTSETLRKYSQSKIAVYRDLAANCASVSELVFKIEIYGSKWTKWDWILFFSFLDYEQYFVDRNVKVFRPVYPGAFRSEDAVRLLKDIFETIDSGDLLDDVVTNKDIILTFISWIGSSKEKQVGSGVCHFLAHVFKKFPDMWTMNWMYIRHRGEKAGRRTHRLADYVPAVRRCEEYYSSSAYLDDFIHRYWRRRTEDGVRF